MRCTLLQAPTSRCSSQRLGIARAGLPFCHRPRHSNRSLQRQLSSAQRSAKGTSHVAAPLRASTAEPVTSVGTEAEGTKTVFVRASDLTRSLLLEIYPEGKGQAVVIVGVLEGSEADKAGIMPGQKIIAISDAIRPDTLWPLGSRASLRFVKDTFSMMRNKDVGLQLSPPTYTAFAGTVSDAESIDEDSMTLVSDMKTSTDTGAADGVTIGERLAQRYNEAQTLKVTKSEVQKRIEKRKAYMEEVSQRSDSSFVAWAIGLFLGPALVILALAYATGYLDNMYVNSLAAFRS